ncbi:MAG: DUF1499 domain-containing protein [Gemmatimonadota bacterium]
MKLARVVFGLGVVAFLLLALAGPGSRLGLWQFGTGFKFIQWGFFLGCGVVVLALIAAVASRPFRSKGPLLAGALLLGGIAAFLPFYVLRQAKSVPPIHDVTTDLEDPPVFVAVLPLRADAPNPAAYGGPEVAAAQRKGYPDLHPLEIAAPAPAAFARAAEAARRMGWAIVATDSASGRIEATATTPWFGFKDDVVVRVRPAQTGSRIDVRSVSRVGGSDVGTNAKRIRSYLAQVRGS